MYKKITSNVYLLIIFSILSLCINSCGLYKKTDSRKVPVNAKERAMKNVEEGKGIRFNNKNKSGDFVFATSNALWRASLDILDFTPLSNVDYSGGIIITDWFSEEENQLNSIKITVRFLSNEIRADGLEIILHKKSCKVNNNCQIEKIDTGLSNDIKVAILRKAALLQDGDNKKNVEEYRKKYGKRKIQRDGKKGNDSNN